MAHTGTLLGTLSLIFLVYFRPLIALHVHQQFDEVCYLEWLYPYVGSLHPICYSNSHLSGVVAAWLPFAQLAKWTALLTHESAAAWIEYFVGLSAYFYFGLALFFLVRYCQLKNRVKSEPILLLMTVPVLHFATQDTHLTHSVEFFLAVVVIYLIERQKFWHALMIAFLLSVTRINDAPAIFLVLASLFDRNSKPRYWKLLWWPSAILVTGAVLWLCYDIGFVRGYNQTWFFPLIQTASIDKVIRLFFAQDWGLVWTAPFWLFTFAVGLFRVRKLSHVAKAGLFWMFVELCVAAVWRGNGRYFGHRYILGSYAACLLIWTEIGIHSWSLYIGRALATYTAIYLLFLQWIYPTAWPWPIIDNFSVNSPPYGVILASLSNNSHVFFAVLGDTPIGVLIQEWRTSTTAFSTTQLALLWILTGIAITLVLVAIAVKAAFLDFHRISARFFIRKKGSLSVPARSPI